MFDTVDLYCERTGPEFWSEPINALTNLFFLLFAWLVWKRTNSLTVGAWILLLLMCAIGIGSMLFHTFAVGWSRFLDVLPILFFQLVFIWLYCHVIIKYQALYTFGIVALYFVATMIGRQFPQILNGSLIYAPALIFLFILGIFHMVTERAERYIIIVATGLFVASLTFRTMDNLICNIFPIGTHFMWHICNAIVLYLLLKAYLANDQQDMVKSGGKLQY